MNSISPENHNRRQTKGSSHDGICGVTSVLALLAAPWRASWMSC
jgi:hypothetical protein